MCVNPTQSSFFLADPHADPERLRDYFRADGLGDLVRHALKCPYP
jgi:hypothetical protein